MEARAAHYIDRALGGALAASRETYRSGLTALDAYACKSKGGGFRELPAEGQDAVLTDMEKRRFPRAFFCPGARRHTFQGMFGDPYYGGNFNFIGWDLLGYPGIRLACQQAIRRRRASARVHKSAYDFAMFDRASAAASPPATAPKDRHTWRGMGDT